MSASSGGGYCDCGDVEAWKRDPFCEYHLQGSIAASSSSADDDVVRSSLPEGLNLSYSPSYALNKTNVGLILTLMSFYHLPGVRERCDAMLTICFDYCNVMLNWDGNEAPALNYAKLLSPRQDGPHLTMLFNDEVHTYQQVTDALQVYDDMVCCFMLFGCFIPLVVINSVYYSSARLRRDGETSDGTRCPRRSRGPESSSRGIAVRMSSC